MSKCERCNDTGIIETGNNDLPCDCPAGDKALFNTVGIDRLTTGKELRKYLANRIKPISKKSELTPKDWDQDSLQLLLLIYL